MSGATKQMKHEAMANLSHGSSGSSSSSGSFDISMEHETTASVQPEMQGQLQENYQQQRTSSSSPPNFSSSPRNNTTSTSRLSKSPSKTINNLTSFMSNLIHKIPIPSLQNEDSKKKNKKKVSVDDFDKIAVIGKGAFGEVSLVKYKQNNQIFAMKKLKKSEMLKRNQVQHIRAERDIMAKDVLQENSGWIVQLFYSFQDSEHLYMAMEYCPGGDLMVWLKDLITFTEDQTKFYIAELVLAVHSLHSKLEYVHRDIKPDNILIDKTGHLKLSDFGLSKAFSNQLLNDLDENTSTSSANSYSATSSATGGSIHKLKVDTWRKRGRVTLFSTVGSVGYTSPEILQRKGYGIECDWWSVGVIMYEMLVGYPPFFDEDPMEVCRKIVNFKEFLEFPSDVSLSNEAKDLIRRFLSESSCRIGRKGISEIQKHPFFKGVDWKNIRQQKAPFQPVLSNDTDLKYFAHMFQQEAPTTTVSPQQQQADLASDEALVAAYKQQLAQLVSQYQHQMTFLKQQQQLLQNQLSSNSQLSPQQTQQAHQLFQINQLQQLQLIQQFELSQTQLQQQYVQLAQVQLLQRKQQQQQLLQQQLQQQQQQVQEKRDVSMMNTSSSTSASNTITEDNLHLAFLGFSFNKDDPDLREQIQKQSFPVAQQPQQQQQQQTKSFQRKPTLQEIFPQ